MAKKKVKLPFDLEKAKAGAKVVTKGGCDVRILCYDMRTESYPIVAIINDYGNESARVYSTSGKLVIGQENPDDLQIVEEVEMPKRWRDRKDATLYGYYINEESCIVSDDCRGGYAHDSDNHNVFATKKQAQSALAMAQISQIMANDERFGGVVTDKEWLNCNTSKYCFYRYQGHIENKCCCDQYEFIAFHTREQRELFYQENLDLLKQYFMI